MDEKRKFLLDKIFKKGIRENIPNISKENTRFLRNFIVEKGIKSMLEIGTAHGYSTINFAIELEKVGGNIDTIEFSQPSYEIACEHIEESGLRNISQYFGDARDIIPHIHIKYDLIFIDGMKKASLQFFNLVWNKVNMGGTVIIDDVIKFRHKMENLYENLENNDISYDVIQIDEDDGIMIIKKQ